jgi:hypothetical protein
MAVLGRLLRNRRAGEGGLAWNLPNLGTADTFDVHSPDFEPGGAIPLVCAARRVGGSELSPALAWPAPSAGTAQLLLVVEDVDVPLRVPIVHCLALLHPAVTQLDRGALVATGAPDGVRILRSSISRGYLGPAPIKGHGPHRYVFQVFALGRAVPDGVRGRAVDTARPRDVLRAAGEVLARGRLHGCYERT